MTKEQFEHLLQELKASKEDIRPSEVVFFSEPLRTALNQAVRIGKISLTDFAKLLEAKQEQAQQLIDILVERHLLHPSAFTSPTETYYETRLSAATRPLARPPSDFWKKIGG